MSMLSERRHRRTDSVWFPLREAARAVGVREVESRMVVAEGCREGGSGCRVGSVPVLQHERDRW